jgi:CRP/FNR family transcriptional regulator, cyclic AMP receptor protein
MASRPHIRTSGQKTQFQDNPSSATPIGGTQGLLLGLPEHLFARLFNRTAKVRLRADETLFVTGDAGDGCYRVENGLLKVTMVSRSGSERILAFVGPGTIVGELSVVDSLPRSASVIAVRDATLSFLSRANSRISPKNIPRSTGPW